MPSFRKIRLPVSDQRWYQREYRSILSAEREVLTEMYQSQRFGNRQSFCKICHCASKLRALLGAEDDAFDI